MADLTTLLSKFLGNLAFYSGSVSGALTTSTTSYSTVGTSEEDAWSYSLPANTLSRDGQMLRITLWGAAANTANAKTLKYYFGSTSRTINNVTAAPQNGAWEATIYVARTGAATQESIVLHSLMLQTPQIPARDTPAETLSGAVTIKLTFTTAAAAGDLTFKGAVVELLN